MLIHTDTWYARLGSFYVPLMPVVGLISAIIIFSVKYGSMLLFLEPFNEEYRSKATDNFNIILLLVTLVVSSLPVAYTIVALPSPTGCGPYRE